MKHASILLLTLGLCGLSFAACAEGDDSTFGNKPSGGTGGDGGKGSGNSSASSSGSNGSSASSASSSGGTSSGGVCSLKCAADTECQTGCNNGKPPPVGVYCCDTGTGTCYVSGAMTCPSQGAGSSGGMYP